MLRGWLLEPSARFSFVDGSSMAVRRCHGVTGSNGSWLSIRVCALSWRKRLTKDQSMTAPPCDLCSMKWFQATPLEPLWPMPSSTASATTGTSVNRLVRRASFRLNEASRAGSFTECVRKCGPPSPPSFIVNASTLRPSSARSNANSQPKHRAVRSPPNANKRFYSAWPTTSISSGHFILDFHFMPEAFQQGQIRSNMNPIIRIFAFFSSVLVAGFVSAADYPTPTEGDYTIRDFKFQSGETLPELRLHYRTLGKPDKDAQGKTTNAVLIMHGTTGSGAQFIRPEFAGELFGKDQPLDATKFFIVLPDGIGHGKSSKPSDGMHAKFPRYGYLDMVEAQYRLLTEGLGVNHARLVMGTSMGGMHTWLWGESHPDFMDALMPLASLPTQISGRNRAWRRMVIDAIRNDPAWEGGEYKTQPPSLRTAAEMLWFMSSNPVLRQKEAPTLAKTDEVLDKFVEQIVKTDDANDVLYALEASRDYDPGPNLEKIRAPLLAINSADDLINPPELGILEREIKRLSHGRAIVMPLTEKTRGHGSHTIAALWKDQLVELLKETQK